jgi:4-amino-4-deoxy-L-arabinose transferase-like glycosyltransferase
MIQVSRRSLQFLFGLVNIIFFIWLLYITIQFFFGINDESISKLPRPFVLIVISVAMIAALIVLLMLFSLVTQRNSFTENRLLVFLFAVALLARAAWLYFFGEVKLESDFELYMTLAGNIAEHGTVPAELEWYVAFAPYVLGYSFLLAFLLSVFGQDVFTAQALNVLLSAVSTILIYLIAKKVTGKVQVGFIAATVWIAFPAFIALATLPATEPTFIALFLAVLYACLALIKCADPARRYGPLVIAIVLIVLMNEIRPLGFLMTLTLVALLLVVNLLQIQKRWKHFFVQTCLVLIVYMGVTSISSSLKEAYLQREIAESGLGFGLYLGLNYDEVGTWNLEDAQLVGEAFNENMTNKQFNQQMIDRSGDRFHDLVRRNLLFPLVMKKVVRFWSDPHAFVRWTEVSLIHSEYKTLLRRISTLSLGFYGSLLFLSLFGTLADFWRKDSGYQVQSFYLKVIILFFVLIYMFFDNNARYVIPPIVLLSITAAHGMAAVYEVLPSFRQRFLNSTRTNPAS